MIIWGGEGSAGILNTGSRYNPATDSWTPTGANNAPTARSGHTAVWTGSQMIVWGGGSNTGGKYDPGTNSWTATSIINAPLGGYDYSSIWTGGEMIVWGGGDGSGSFGNGGWRYNPVTDTWTPTSTNNVPTARARHTAVWTGSEMIVWGGNDDSRYLNTGGRYNPSADSWTATRDYQCTPWANLAHGGLDRQRNDRMGWLGWLRYRSDKHRWEILRECWCCGSFATAGVSLTRKRCSTGPNHQRYYPFI